MKTKFKCPICKKKDWKVTKTFTYYRAHINTRPDEYLKLRYKILFGLWFPNNKIKVFLELIQCQNCGFVCYTPRPDKKDENAKYNFLEKNEKEGGQPDKEKLGGHCIRAKRVYDIIVTHKDDKNLKVLDFGGGNGLFLFPFLQNGHSCYLIDRCVRPIPGIRKITFKDIKNDEKIPDKFDIIMCNHVLEHITDPVKIIKILSSYLSKDGIMYCEVPMEVDKDGVTSQPYIEPINHINFFTFNSFKRLFQDLELIELTKREGSYGTSKKDVLIGITKLK